MDGGVTLGWAEVDDQIDESAALRSDHLGGLGVPARVLVAADRILGEDVNDDAGRGGLHGRTMHGRRRAIEQALPSLCPAARCDRDGIGAPAGALRALGFPYLDERVSAVGEKQLVKYVHGAKRK